MAEYVTSHDASIGKRGLVYIPQCIREMLPEGVRNMYASLEKRRAGNCVVLRTTSKSLFSVEVAISSDGYVAVKDLYVNVGIRPPFRWQATAQMPESSIDTLILWQTKDLEVPKEKGEEFAGVLREAWYGRKKN